jgi:hypothetical protein
MAFSVIVMVVGFHWLEFLMPPGRTTEMHAISHVFFKKKKKRERERERGIFLTS